MPETAKETLATFENLSNPIGAFLEERCVLGADRKIPCADLYGKWQSWCKAQGRDYTGTSQSFGADLHAAVPEIVTKGVRVPNNPVPVRHYVGIDGIPV